MYHKMTPTCTCVYSWVKTVKNKYPLLLICRMQQRAGEKFFESSKHSGGLKKMKKRLGETADFHMKYSSGNLSLWFCISSNIFS